MDQEGTTPVRGDFSSSYDFEDVLRIQKEHNERLVNRYDNVISTGVGLKLVDGQPTGERAIILFVRQKVKHGGLVKLSLDQVAPEHVEGVPVDVIEVGDIVKHAGYTRRTRPVSPGYSVSQGNVTAGTLGGIFVDRDGDVVALSNNHIFGDENRAKIGDPIYQPGIADMPPGFNLRFSGFHEPVQNLPYFATLKKFVPLRSEGVTPHDSAIALVAPEVLRQQMLSPNYPNGKPLSGVGMATPGMNTQKFGRTSGQTAGRVLAIGAPFSVGYDMGPVKFENCIVCTAMSRGGDSGSILLDEQMNVIGLLFAGSDKVTIFHPIDAVMREYGLRLWVPQQGSELEFWGRKWKPVYPPDALTLNKQGVLIVDGPANRHVFAETRLEGAVSAVSVDVFTGSDQGVTWGPGLAITFPGGTLKLNVRYNQGFSVGWNSQEFVSRTQSSEPNRWYTLQLRLGSDWVVGEVTDKTSKSGRWVKVTELPSSNVQGQPQALRLGKFDLRGGPGDSESGPGPDGCCQFANLNVV